MLRGASLPLLAVSLLCAPAALLHGADVPGERIIEATPAAPNAAPARSIEPDPGTVIGAQDLLEIRVFQLDQFNQTVRVADDGTIALPLLGKIPVAGLTREQVEKEIATRLGARYVNDPQVSVFVKEYRSRRIAVTGAVQKPDTYEMLGSRTVLEMLAMAGGVTKDVARTVVVFRQEPEGPPRRIELPLDGLLYGGDPAANITLRAGDIVYVPIEEIVKVYVNGAVGKPGAIEMRRSAPITVLQAVTAAGGTSARASEKRTRVVRQRSDGTKEVLPVDLRRVKQGRADDITLQPDDVVFVPEAYF